MKEEKPIEAIEQGFAAAENGQHVHRRGAVIDAVQSHEELLALSGERARRERAAALRAELEAEFPGITKVERVDDAIVVSADPWSDAIAIGLPGLDRKLERS